MGAEVVVGVIVVAIVAIAVAGLAGVAVGMAIGARARRIEDPMRAPEATPAADVQVTRRSPLPDYAGEVAILGHEDGYGPEERPTRAFFGASPTRR